MTSPWKLDGHIAQFTFGSLTGKLDLTRPALGIATNVPGAKGDDLRLLAVGTDEASSPDDLIESYVRENDLVATYPESPEQPLRRQAYWRLVAETAGGVRTEGIELILSAQTSRLGVDEPLHVTGRLPCGEIRICGSDGDYLSADSSRDELEINQPRIVLFRLQGSEYSYAELCYPGDVQHTKLHRCSNGGCLMNHTLLSPGLEKGVIRRSRLRGLFLPRENDLVTSAAAFEAFLASELPLTT